MRRNSMRKKNSLTVAFTGGGGKTGLIFYLAEKFSRQGKRVIITTTTHMAWEPERPFAEAEDIPALCSLMERYGYVTAAHHKAGQPKISGPSEEILEMLSGLCDLLLVEADGSRHFPLKVPAAHEPVIPEVADLVVGVIGLDCIGKRICDTAHRPENVADFLGKCADDPVSWEDAARIAVSERGLRKGVGQRPFLVYLNKMDILKDKESAGRIQKKCLENGIEAVCGSLPEADRREKNGNEAGTDHAGSREQPEIWK